ncbi:MAG: hypothetical protein O6848_05285 [Bacteroidetes bacterium]|nr:hypothetical protein [Bacteroidota bacterium]
MKKLLAAIIAISLVALVAFAIPVKKEITTTNQEILKIETHQIVDQQTTKNDQLFDFDSEAN